MKNRISIGFTIVVLSLLLILNAKDFQFFGEARADDFWSQAQMCSHEMNARLNREVRIAYIEEPSEDGLRDDAYIFHRITRYFLAPTLLDFNPGDLTHYRYVLLFYRDPHAIDWDRIEEKYSEDVILTCGNYALLSKGP